MKWHARACCTGPEKMLPSEYILVYLIIQFTKVQIGTFNITKLSKRKINKAVLKIIVQLLKRLCIANRMVIFTDLIYVGT